MQRKLLALMLTMIMLVPYIPIEMTYAWVIGSNNGAAAGGLKGTVYPTPSFRVGLINEEFREGNLYRGTRSEKEDIVIQHYVNHFPKMANNNIIEIEGVDVLDGTPVLDIKPYSPHLNPHS